MARNRRSGGRPQQPQQQPHAQTGGSGGGESLSEAMVAELATEVAGNVAYVLTEEGIHIGPVQDFLTFLRKYVSDNVIGKGIMLMGPTFQVGLQLAGHAMGWSPIAISRFREPLDEIFDAAKDSIGRKGTFTKEDAAQARERAYELTKAQVKIKPPYFQALQSLPPNDQRTLFRLMQQFSEGDAVWAEKLRGWKKDQMRNPNTLRVLIGLRKDEWEPYLNPEKEEASHSSGIVEAAGHAWGNTTSYLWNLVTGDKAVLRPWQKDAVKAARSLREGRRALQRVGRKADAAFHMKHNNVNRMGWPEVVVLAIAALAIAFAVVSAS